MINDYKNKNILILGLGTYGGGLGAAKFLARQGANLVISDTKTKQWLSPQMQKLGKYKNIKYILGSHKGIFKLAYDLAIINPAIDLRSPIIKEIKKRRIPIDTELGLFLKNCNGKVIAITGTKGKSTTTALVYKILKDAGENVMFGGNIGVSLLEKLPRIKKDTYVVLEISSFQLDLIPQETRFYITALTNIFPDHLDRYNSFADYKKSKLGIFKHPSRYKILHSEVRLPNWINREKIRLQGKHNLQNIMLAVKIAGILKIPREKIAHSIYTFKGLEHRLEFVKKIRGVSFYNDSASTTPDSTIAAIQALEVEPLKRLILIAGGAHKGTSLAELGKTIAQKVKLLVLFGRDADILKNSLPRRSDLRIKRLKTLTQTVHMAYKDAKSGDVILLSPAMASFDQFINASERGKIFKKLINDLR